MSVGKSVKHDSAISHVTGESIFIDDRPLTSNEVLVGVYGSSINCGTLKSIDIEKALEVEGIEGIYTHSDFHDNLWGTIIVEQPLLVKDKIGYHSEPICIIAGSSYQAINEARSLIEAEYIEQDPIITIDQAIKEKSFSYDAPTFTQGDPEKAISSAPHKLKGDFFCGGQEHFYLESQAAIAYPLENGQIEVHSSSQHPTETQHTVAHALGLSFHQVSCVVKRMGGGFGGKESQAAPIAAYAALVASKLKVAARIVLTKDEDMAITGKRHPFKNFYEVGFDDEGRILGIKGELYSDGGAYADLSSSIFERAMFHFDSAYFLEHVTITGKVCRTNHYSNTAFRGFGGPQGAMTMESIIEDIANYLGLDPFEVRKTNCYGIDDRNKTPYGQIVEHNQLPKLFKEIESSADYTRRKKEIDQFNLTSKGKIRGISVTPTKFGIAFTAKFLNQGNALVNLHVDGSVQASTGATEMGQGVNTKIQQVIAHAFGIEPDNIQLMPTSTQKNHNTSPTAASSGSDINCAAALKACNKIKERLAAVAEQSFLGKEFNDVDEYQELLKEDLSHIVFKGGKVLDTKRNKEDDFKNICSIAYLNRVSLGEYAHFKTQGIGFDKNKVIGKAFSYFTNGVACSEVEVDSFTGEVKVLRSDILMDLGRRINPGIDRGQVTGAFIQGMGWVTSESLYHNDKGALISHSPTTYKIPNIQDTPRVFNIDFIENETNDVNIHRSKAVGEPPFLLGISVWTAIKNALHSKCSGFNLKSPATNEEILMTLERSSNE